MFSPKMTTTCLIGVCADGSAKLGPAASTAKTAPAATVASLALRRCLDLDDMMVHPQRLKKKRPPAGPVVFSRTGGRPAVGR
jgi:hypothetical protein